MRILAIETGAPPGSIALLSGERVLMEHALADSQRTVQTLFPEVQRLLRAADWQPRDIELIALTIGPGSFTGLRIGVALAKTWAFATSARVVGLPTFDVIAAQADTQQTSLWAVLNAQRRELFAMRYERPGAQEAWRAVGEVQIVARDRWLSQLAGPVAVIGPGLRELGDQLRQRVEAPGTLIDVLPAAQWTPQARTSGQLAFWRMPATADDDFLRLAPYYCRRSAAEEKLEERSS